MFILLKGKFKGFVFDPVIGIFAVSFVDSEFVGSVEDGAWDAVAKDLSWHVIEVMSGEAAACFQMGDDVWIAGIQKTIPVLLGVLNGTVILRTANGAIDGDYHPLGEDIVNGL